jgi:UPF0755 protein
MEELQPQYGVVPEETQILSSRFSLGITLVLLILTIVFVSIFTGYMISRPPADFTPQAVMITPGSTIAQIVDIMAQENIVRSSNALYVTLLSLYRHEPIKAGTYKFESASSVFDVAYLLTQTIPQDELVSITLPEGMRVNEYAKIADRVLADFDVEIFMALASTSEGLLWPETYFVPPTYSAEELFMLLRQSHDEIWQKYQEDIAQSSLSLLEINTLASLVEREANDEASMKMVAGILQNRLDIEMPLQADASIEYVLDTPLNQLRPGELAQYLEELDSPYNTYLYRGLPPTPIGNPGRLALEAVLFPTDSPYLFYITGDDGEFYYATTFAEHQQNVDRYLR